MVPSCPHDSRVRSDRSTAVMWVIPSLWQMADARSAWEGMAPPVESLLAAMQASSSTSTCIQIHELMPVSSRGCCVVSDSCMLQEVLRWNTRQLFSTWWAPDTSQARDHATLSLPDPAAQCSQAERTDHTVW